VRNPRWVGTLPARVGRDYPVACRRCGPGGTPSQHVRGAASRMTATPCAAVATMITRCVPRPTSSNLRPTPFSFARSARARSNSGIRVPRKCTVGELVHSTRDGRRLVVASRWVVQTDEERRPVAYLEVNYRRDRAAAGGC